ncbi:hypothetical protein F4V91_32725 [Neorhizobium galegae]|uniref:Uncharacterized protein n=1 Tax=Neorhizobium galegae TaxID=399 RepID=A0A6A1TGC1_NEOGA|nr:hypothetical protein F4V91_32725 [Neorhizobium galegae]
MIGKLNLPAHLQPGSTSTILVANPVKRFATEPQTFPQVWHQRSASGLDARLRIRHADTR